MTVLIKSHRFQAKLREPLTCEKCGWGVSFHSLYPETE